MLLLSLDPGITTGFAVFTLRAGLLMPCEWGVLGGGSHKGRVGRYNVRTQLARELERFQPDEVAIEEARTGQVLHTSEASKGAWEAAYRLAEQVGSLRIVHGKAYGLYSRSTVLATVARLCPLPLDARVVNGRWKPTEAQLRRQINAILGIDLKPGDPDHIANALAVGCCHAARAHNWRPPAYRLLARPRHTDGLIEAIERRRREAVGR